MNIGIIPNLTRDPKLEVTKEVVRLLKSNFKIYIIQDIADKLSQPELGKAEEFIFKNSDFLIVIGGDGTMLDIVQKIFTYDLPIVGINSGRLGFLADIESSELKTLLTRFYDKTQNIETRMMVRATITCPNGTVKQFHALNDVTINRAGSNRIIEFEIRINNYKVDSYTADGIIISTPTGSTGYNLSAGGPIVVPYSRNIIITPICPHTLYSRSIVLTDKDEVSIKTEGTIDIDGQSKIAISNMHNITIDCSQYETQLIKLSEKHFFEVLRNKIIKRSVSLWE
ncbi:hypothetical protein AN639_00765 [Candidatus Epulonipiscium fishelsonii]|uniref:Uncharacterized protein n=1 Tax=Candidatus Epulonipiscium fishelsonii TaxID=77094 RepID=A0ACC8X7N9_9FIRM|nr:hypothetical protein AN396_12390 [Epulopiscium sp. SCG-B11WGA-EpuloA1]ONI41330.1 hypothetical protein AN639_00765 [Epulopiscium sp. SCG-B05WGA-EpuloA1]